MDYINLLYLAVSSGNELMVHNNSIVLVCSKLECYVKCANCLVTLESYKGLDSRSLNRRQKSDRDNV